MKNQTHSTIKRQEGCTNGNKLLFSLQWRIQKVSLVSKLAAYCPLTTAPIMKAHQADPSESMTTLGS